MQEMNNAQLHRALENGHDFFDEVIFTDHIQLSQTQGRFICEWSVFKKGFAISPLTFEGAFSCRNSTFESKFDCGNATFLDGFYCEGAVFNGHCFSEDVIVATLLLHAKQGCYMSYETAKRLLANSATGTTQTVRKFV